MQEKTTKAYGGESEMQEVRYILHHGLCILYPVVTEGGKGKKKGFVVRVKIILKRKSPPPCVLDHNYTSSKSDIFNIC